MKLHRLVVIIVIMMAVAAMVFRVKSVLASEINLSVEGNGTASTNEVQSSNTSSTTISQTNTASIENNIVVDSNTGGNEASANTGDSTITTGASNTQIAIVNQQLNTNIAQGSSGGSSTNASIINNGENSSNAIIASSLVTAVVNQNNTLNLSNEVLVNANTGGNSSRGNAGSASIISGNIYSETNILNRNSNNTYASVGVGRQDSSTNIEGNGKDSVNRATVNSENKLFVNVFNYANIFNKDVQYLTTGRSTVKDNLGNVFIKTGNITAIKNITNENINTSFVDVKKDVCPTVPSQEEKPNEEKPPQVSPPSQGGGGQGNVGGGSSSSNNGGGSIGGKGGGDVLGSMLPKTGSYLLYWMSLALLIAFFSGWYLRFRSGCAPGFAYARA